MNKIWKYSGIFLFVTGYLHTLVAILIGKNELLQIIRDGFVNALGRDYALGLAFWFLICGIFLIIFGHVLHHYIKKEQKPAPAFLGYYLLIFSILGCLVVPVSGFWLFIPQALIIIFADRKQSLRNRVVGEFVKSINEHHIDGIYELMADDFIFTDAYGNEETGKEHMRKSWIGYFQWFPDYRIEITNILPDGHIFVILGFASGTYQNKKSVNNENYWRLPASWKVIVDNHKIKQWQVYCDSKIPFDIIERNNEAPTDLSIVNRACELNEVNHQ